MLNSLYIAQSGLLSSRVSIDNISNNVANENTPDTKRVVNVSEADHLSRNSTGRGTIVGNVERITSDYLYTNLVDESTKEAYFKELSSMLSDIESVFKETDTAGLSKDIDGYFQALEDLKANRNDAVFINNYKTKANALVQDIKTLYDGVEAKEASTLESVKLDTVQVNSILEEIGSINRKLGNKSEPTNDLLDRRDYLEKQLATYVNIEVNKVDEPYELTINGQRAVWADNVRSYSVAEEYVTQQDKYVAADGVTSSLAAAVGTFDNNDKIVYTLNNVGSVEVVFGTYVKDSQGNNLDLDGDSIPDLVDGSNYIRALAETINNDPYMNKIVTVYNGDYTKDEAGNIIAPDMSVDRHLLIEAKNGGTAGNFESTLEFKRIEGGPLLENVAIAKNTEFSRDGTNNIYLQSGEKMVEIESGSIKAKLDNLTTLSGNNKFQSYKDALNKFAFTLSDIHSEYAVSTTDGSFIYGQDAFDNMGTDIQNVKSLGLFSGSDVKTLTFHENAVNNLTQQDLDYLGTIHWKSDFSFENGAQNPDSADATSFSKFFQQLHVNVAEDKANTDFMLESQESVTASLGSAYDQIVKVDKDEEMLSLVKFQAAYEANAKVISIVDEMLQTLLGIKR